MVISYKLVDEYPGWSEAPRFLGSLLEKYSCRRVFEIGSGANPTLAADYVTQKGIHYVTNDIDPDQLAKADPVYDRMVLDFTVPALDRSLHGSFDCIFSRNVSEHIHDGRQYHRNILSLLRPGGISVHCFSTLWALPFTANRLLPESLGSFLYNTFAPRESYKHGKFKAYYSWSRGPTSSALRRFQLLGFEVVEYTGFFGHRYYIHRAPLLHKLEGRKSRFLVRHPIPQLTAYAAVILRRPGQASTSNSRENS